MRTWYATQGYVDPQLRAKLERFVLAWQYGGLVSYDRLPENAKRVVAEHYETRVQ